jgi:hypothetical protein
MKHKQLIQTLSLPALALLALAFTGCGSTNVSVAPDSAPVSGPMGASGQTIISRASQLQIGVATFAPNATDQSLASQVEKQVEGRLNQLGLQLMPGGGDLSVDISVKTDIFDKSGNYYRIEGTTDTQVRRNLDRSIVDSRSINVRGERKLGESAARDTLAMELSRETANWVAGLLSDQSLHLSANDITIRLSMGKDSAEYSRLFIREVEKLDGVASVMLTGQDFESRQLTFRVVYFQRKIPQGILHRIALVEELDIRL